MITAPRTRLAVLPTPVGPLRRRASTCVKRDDLTGFGVSGNKARALEYLLGDALARGCDLLVTGGGPDSNFVAAAAMAARVTGLDCELVVPDGAPGAGPPGGADDAGHARESSALVLARAAGARVHRFDGPRESIDTAVDELAARRRADGRRPVAIPRGGSTPVGALGFARAAGELADQVATGLLPPPSTIVIAVGSGGSVAGLLAGLATSGLTCRIVGASVSRPPREITGRVHELAAACAARQGWTAPDLSRLDVVDARGPGFGTASDADRAAAARALHDEGLLLDDTYGAKAFAVAEALTGGPLVFWHTGGVAKALAHVAPAPVSVAEQIAEGAHG